MTKEQVLRDLNNDNGNCLWIAMDLDGTWCVFGARPNLDDELWLPQDSFYFSEIEDLEDTNIDILYHGDWKDSLTEFRL